MSVVRDVCMCVSEEVGDRCMCLCVSEWVSEFVGVNECGE